jgi:hypothetical protein
MELRLRSAIMSASPFSFSVHQIVAALGGQVTGPDTCNIPGPGHSGKDKSLSIKIDPTAPDGFVVYSHAGDDAIECKDWIRQKLGLPQWAPSRRADGAKAGATDYVYTQADGTPYLRVRRTADKRFWQQKWDGKGWVNGAPNGSKIPYRLPELLAAEHDDVFIAEGEKDVDNLVKQGFTATTNSGGAKKWSSDLNRHFVGKNVYILPDNDDAGFDHARIVAAHLLQVARAVHVINLPGLPPKGDVSDWFKAGGSADQLADFAREAKPINSVERNEPEPIAKQASSKLPEVDETAKPDLSWRFTLICNRFGAPKPLLANVVIVLRNEERWRAVLAFDEFAYRIMLLAPPPWEPSTKSSNYMQRAWTEQDDLAATHWLQTVEGITVTPAVTAQAVELVARDRTYHPVRDYVRSREWDRTDRLATLLSTYFGAEQSNYTEAIGRMMSTPCSFSKVSRA